MGNDYRSELEKAYQEALMFLREEGWETLESNFGVGQGNKEVVTVYDGPEQFLQKDRLLLIFNNL